MGYSVNYFVFVWRLIHTIIEPSLAACSPVRWRAPCDDDIRPRGTETGTLQKD